MSRVLVLGYALPRHQEGVRTEAYNYRTWQVTDPVAADGHAVRLVAISRFRAPLGAGQLHLSDPALDAWLVEQRQRGWRRRIQRLHDEFSPDAVVATGQLMCQVACGIRTEAPLWLDLYGDPIFEWQAAMHATRSHQGVRSVVGWQTILLRHGDVFSTLSTPQTEAYIGRLALVGRLNHLTCGYEFVHTLLPGMPPGMELPTAGPIIRARVVPADAFVVLWVGGFNAWSDPDTLFAGLERAMERHPRIHFVSIGGPVVSADRYHRLESLVAGSPRRERYHLLGWMHERAHVLAAYREADVGISTDLAIYETRFGSRTRLVEMVRNGLPVVSSAGSEIVDILRRQGAGFDFATGDAEGLARVLLHLAADPSALRAAAERGQALADTVLSFATTTTPLREWVKAPRHAPDRGWKRRWSVENSLRWRVRRTVWRLLGLG